MKETKKGQFQLQNSYKFSHQVSKARRNDSVSY